MPYYGMLIKYTLKCYAVVFGHFQSPLPSRTYTLGSGGQREDKYCNDGCWMISGMWKEENK